MGKFERGNSAEQITVGRFNANTRRIDGRFLACRTGCRNRLDPNALGLGGLIEEHEHPHDGRRLQRIARLLAVGVTEDDRDRSRLTGIEIDALRIGRPELPVGVVVDAQMNADGLRAEIGDRRGDMPKRRQIPCGPGLRRQLNAGITVGPAVGRQHEPRSGGLATKFGFHLRGTLLDRHLLELLRIEHDARRRRLRAKIGQAEKNQNRARPTDEPTGKMRAHSEMLCEEMGRSARAGPTNPPVDVETTA